MSTRKRSLRGTITAAEVAVTEQDMHTAEEALLEALGRVRKEKSNRGGADD